MWWTVLGVLGIACLVAAALLWAGPALALAVAGVSAVLAAIDGRAGDRGRGVDF